MNIIFSFFIIFFLCHIIIIPRTIVLSVLVFPKCCRCTLGCKEKWNMSFFFYNTQHLIMLAWQRSVPVAFLYKWGNTEASEIYSCTLPSCRQPRIFPSFLACDILKQTLLFVVIAQVAEKISLQAYKLAAL